MGGKNFSEKQILDIPSGPGIKTLPFNAGGGGSWLGS